MQTPSLTLDILRGQCRDAALGELPWETLLRNICIWVDGDRAMMLSAHQGRPYISTASYNHDLTNVSAYNLGLNCEDPRMPLSKLTRPGETRTGQEYLENREIFKTDYFNLVSRRADQLDSLHSVILESASSGRQAISIHRSFKSEIFGQSEIDRMQNLLPHLIDAYHYAIKISGKISPDLKARDCAFLIKPDLKTVLLSGSPDNVIRGNPSFGWNGEDLRVKNKAFGKFLELAFVRGAQNQAFECRIQIPEARTANSRSFLKITTYPKPQMIDWIWDMENVLVLYVTRIRTEFDSQNCEMFAEIFQLTQSESRTLTHLVEAGSLRDAALQSDVSYETMRWHLKNIFVKTGYHTQDGLMNAVATMDLSNMC